MLPLKSLNVGKKGSSVIYIYFDPIVVVQW